MRIVIAQLLRKEGLLLCNATAMAARHTQGLAHGWRRYPAPTWGRQHVERLCVVSDVHLLSEGRPVGGELCLLTKMDRAGPDVQTPTFYLSGVADDLAVKDVNMAAVDKDGATIPRSVLREQGRTSNDDGGTACHRYST